VLHLCGQQPCYGNQLMDRISGLSGGLVAVNPNTMYPLLRQLEADGLIRGEWEHPERRSRRFYRLTTAGEHERARLAGELEPRLDAAAEAIAAVRRELAEEAGP
jgi:DNA-binding PadR family transcriptional regulator